MAGEKIDFAQLKENALKLLEEAHRQADAQQCRLSTNGKFRPSCDHLDSSIRKRLATFDAVKWTGKPSKLSPLLFASHGWICISSDMLQCEACGEYMCIILPSLVDNDVKVYQKTIRNIISTISTKHQVTCPYKYISSATGDAIPLNALSKDVTNHRYEIMKGLDLEQIEVDIPEVPPSMIPETAEQKCKALICYGWQKSKHLEDAVFCAYCARTVGLWLLRGKSFDAEKQHHKWCIFASDTSRHSDVWQCRRLALQHIKSSKDSPVTNWVAKAEVWKSTIMPKSTSTIT